MSWTSVSVIPIADVNKELSRSTTKTITTFDSKVDAGSIKGRFGEWQIEPTNSGYIILVSTPIKTGTMSIPWMQQSDIDISGAIVRSSVNFKFYPDKKDSNVRHLKFDFDDPDGSAQPGEGKVVAHDVLSAGQLSSVQQTVLSECVAKALTQNADKVSFVFASVNVLSNSKSSWLHSKYSQYYCTKPISSPPTLAVFNFDSPPKEEDLSFITHMSHRKAAGVEVQISKKLFLTSILAPGVMSSMDARGSLQLKGDALVNQGFLQLKKSRTHNVLYSPVITTFNAEVVDDRIRIKVRGEARFSVFEVLSSENVMLQFESGCELGLKLSEDHKTLRYVIISKDKTHTSVHIEKKQGSVASKIVRPIISAIVLLIEEVISVLLVKKLGEDVSAASVAETAPMIVSWFGKRAMKLKSFQLSDSLIFNEVLPHS